jgi:hypothetical protein
MQVSKVFRMVIADGKPFDPLAAETQASEILSMEEKWWLSFDRENGK